MKKVEIKNTMDGLQTFNELYDGAVFKVRNSQQIYVKVDEDYALCIDTNNNTRIIKAEKHIRDCKLTDEKIVLTFSNKGEDFADPY